MGSRFARFRLPCIACPVDEVLRSFIGQALPPDVAVLGERDVCEQGVGPHGFDGNGVGFDSGARRNSEEAGFGVDRAQAAIRVGGNPGNVVAYGRHLPTRQGRAQHGEVGLTASRWERRSDVERLAGWRGDLDQEHVLGQPSLFATKR